MQFWEDNPPYQGGTMRKGRGYKPRQQKENQGNINGKGAKYLLTVTLKTEHTVLLCADIERITINGKGDWGMG